MEILINKMFVCVLFVTLVCSSTAMNFAGIPIDFDAPDAILSEQADDVAHKIVTEYRKFQQTGIKSAVLKQISAQISNANLNKNLFRKDLHELSERETFLTCSVCRATSKVIVDMFRADDGELNGPNNDIIAKRIMLDICDMFNMQTAEVCGGLFDSNWDTIEYILKHSKIDSRTFCSLFLDFSFCSVNNEEYDWTLNIDKTGAAITGPKKDIPKKSENDLHILHLTDIHHDPWYEPGALAECDEPMCCQRQKEIVEGTTKAAGYWGDYRDCDTPWHTVQNALEHIKKTHTKLDYIYQTGDVVDHMVWETSVERNTGVLSRVSDELAKMFPGVQVFPCIGNHEPHPLNVFSPPSVPEYVRTTWMYEHLYNDWSHWLPESTKETILKGGYYTVAPRAGFRIISLNNNDCYKDNWWLYYSGTDAQPQLLWLHDTLLAAEKAGEHVHILAHIPSADGSCWSTWSREYNRIIERFSNTISGIFNGHSHKDEMHVHYSAKDGHAIGMSWNGGALTTFSYKNPNYRVYEVEPQTMQVVDHETWIFNLTEANAMPENGPNWHKEYTFSEEFTTDISPKGVDDLLEKMAAQPDLLRKFWRYKMTSADPRIAEGCGRNCLMSTLCRLATTVSTQKTRCWDLQKKLGVALDNESSTTTTSSTTMSSSSSSTSETSSSTSTEATTTIDPEDDGASSIIALSLSSLLSLLMLVKYIF